MTALAELVQILVKLRETPRKQWRDESRRLLLAAIRTYTSLIEEFRIELSILDADLRRASSGTVYPADQATRVRRLYGDLDRGWAVVRPLADEQIPLGRIEAAREARHGARFNAEELLRYLDRLRRRDRPRLANTVVVSNPDADLVRREMHDVIRVTRDSWDSVAVGLSHLASDLRAGGVI